MVNFQLFYHVCPKYIETVYLSGMTTKPVC